MLSINAPNTSAPPKAKSPDQVAVARVDKDKAVVIYPGGEDAHAIVSIGQFKLLVNTMPAELIAVVPSSLLVDSEVMAFVEQSFKAIADSMRSRMVVYHSDSGVVLVFFKQVWRMASGLAAREPFSSLRELLDAFVAEVLLRREVAFVEIFDLPFTKAKQPLSKHAVAIQ